MVMSMYDFLISKEQARQFAYDCFDAIVRDIKSMEENIDETQEADGTDCQCA